MKKILWFRRDLRVEDNPLLSIEGEVLPIFIFDPNILCKLSNDDCRVSYIFDSVIVLKNNLKELGLNLKIFYGDPEDIFKKLESEGFDEVIASGDYDSYARERDLRVSHIIDFNYLHDTYIFKPNEILKPDDSTYFVFTPYFNAAKKIYNQNHYKEFFPTKQYLCNECFDNIFSFIDNQLLNLNLEIDSIGFKYNPLINQPLINEKLNNLEEVIQNYSQRDFLNSNAFSGLSLELRFGIISVRKILRLLIDYNKKGIDTDSFFRQLVFRDFYAYLLYHIPTLSTDNFKKSFYGIFNQDRFDAFINAKTGVPIIDAGIRELLETGNMHNRVRMICASFFTKDLLLSWKDGEEFFARHLLDYDAASNILSWQWSAGTGVDPQPYFRVFNPYSQSKKFDKDCEYIKKWVPELKNIDSKNIHNEDYLLNNSISNYPKPIVDHKIAAKIAIAKFK